MDVVAAVSEEKKICCCSPKTWTRVVGWLELILCVLVALTTIIVYVEVVQGNGGEDEKADSLPHDKKDQIEKIFGNSVGQGLDKAMALLIAAILLILLALVSPIILLLIVGNEKERAGFFIPWLILSWIGILFTVVGITGLTFSEKYESAMGLLPKLPLSGFLLFVVHRRYSEVKGNKRSGSGQQRGRAEVYEKVDEDEA